ncbi:MAG: hypothetical protein BWZ04_02853 [Firmicutes bacterium ADurb.BinA205]|nr:MAG: hypothetical protein BWZ04_02853 [Firmicutes bacterium ADurb.BinA205]
MSEGVFIYSVRIVVEGVFKKIFQLVYDTTPDIYSPVKQIRSVTFAAGTNRIAYMVGNDLCYKLLPEPVTFLLAAFTAVSAAVNCCIIQGRVIYQTGFIIAVQIIYLCIDSVEMPQLMPEEMFKINTQLEIVMHGQVCHKLPADQDSITGLAVYVLHNRIRRLLGVRTTDAFDDLPPYARVAACGSSIYRRKRYTEFRHDLLKLLLCDLCPE